MKAAVYETYGTPDVIQIRDVARPVPQANEVLIHMQAASVNPLDWHFVRGVPYFLRTVTGLIRPKFRGLGIDVAGHIEAIGSKVTQFKAGDEVFGVGRGTFAEYVCASESVLVTKPEHMTFEQVASVPVAAFTALQGLRDKGRMRAGQRVLINGAAGGVGTLAVQIGKSFDAAITGVCSARNVDLVRSLGADQVIDYTRENFTTRPERYDLIFDCIGNHSLSACRRVLNPKGVYVIVGGPNDRGIGPLVHPLWALLLSQFVSQKLMPLMARWNKEDLSTTRELLATGKIKPVIDRRYTLSEVREAIRHVESGHARGKVVITS